MTNSVAAVTVDAGSALLSGFATLPDEPPRLMIVALHGGGLRASYFDGRVDPSTSLLELAQTLGWAALAVDRPGYGASAAQLPEGLSIIEQAPVIAAAVRSFTASHDLDVPLFLLGHSFGFKVALEIAANVAPPQLIGLEGSGAGVRYNPHLRSYPGRDGDAAVDLSVEDAMDLFWGPERLYPIGTLDRDRRPTARVPSTEARDAATWPAHLIEIAPSVRIPVRYTVADHERWWDVTQGTLDEFARMFSASPRVEIAHQFAAGHNISLGRSARAYHLSVAAFAEECLLGTQG